MKNVAASVSDRLKAISRAEGIQLNRVLEDFAIARLIARLASSKHHDQFVLKGARLFTLWGGGSPYRPTRDADFLSFGSPEPKVLEVTFNEVCASPTEPPDGVEWQPGSAAAIREDNVYGGVRIRLTALLGKIRIPVQIDVGFGDSISPEAEMAEWPMPLDFAPVLLRVYRPETSIAEKLETAVTLGVTNSRMKDFYDLYWLSRNQVFDGSVLSAAVRATFERRGTDWPSETPTAFTEEFYDFQEKQTQWSAFLRKSKLDVIELREVIQHISNFLCPVFDGETGSHEWSPGGVWIEKLRGRSE